MSEEVKVKKEKLWSKNFILAMVVSASVSLANGMFSPALPIYAEKIGITTDIIGSVVSVALLFSMVGRFMVGGLSTKRSKKKLSLISVSLILLAYIMFLFADNIYLVAAAKIMQAAGAGMNITILSTIAIDNLPKNRMGEGIGIYSVAASISQSIAPMIGTMLAKKSQFTLLFGSSAASTALSILVLLLITEAAMDKEENGDNSKSKFSIKDYIYPPAFLPAIMIFFNGIIYSSISNFLSIYGLSKGISNVGIFFTVSSLVMLLSRPFTGKLNDKKSPAFVVIPAIMLATFACVLIAFSTSISTIVVAGALYGLGFGSCQSAIHVMAIKSATPETRGVANSTFFVGGDIGLSLGSGLAGVLAFHRGYEQMYLVMAAISIVSLGVFLIYNSALKRKQR